MKPSSPLPIDPSWSSIDSYVDNLLSFICTSTLFRNLCGGVHILDFLTRKPALYETVLPTDWKDWFAREEVTLDDVLDLVLREDADALMGINQGCTNGNVNGKESKWRGIPPPPTSLLTFISTVHRLHLRRDYKPRDRLKHDLENLPRHIAVGMKPKKIHEVSQFAAFVDELGEILVSGSIEEPDETHRDRLKGERVGQNGKGKSSQKTIIDFGSGQNYLGRTLACPPYNKDVIAIEQRHHNVEGARGMDVSAKLAKKEKRVVNKKEWKAQWQASRQRDNGCDTGQSTDSNFDAEEPRSSSGMPLSHNDLRELENRIPHMELSDDVETNTKALDSANLKSYHHWANGNSSPLTEPRSANGKTDTDAEIEHDPNLQAGSITYIEKELSSGDLSSSLSQNSPPSMVVSIHSCGNLTHHGLRSITLNPSVRAVALIGCCYNLLTERLGPPTYKLPTLRSKHPRLEATSTAFDPQGFPMSKRLEEFTYPIPMATDTLSSNGCQKVHNINGSIQPLDTTGRGVRLNITARMMAVQAPMNWGPKDSEEFFTRHFYRALLQRVLLDLGVVKMSTPASTENIEITGGTLSGKDEAGSPLIIGSLRKACFTSFEAYIRGAVEKLTRDPVDGAEIEDKTKCLFQDGGKMIREYEKEYGYAKKQLSVIWTLMAFTAGLVESAILVDRWLWLKEQTEVVDDAWVEAVFDYRLSPRNMVVVGLKKEGR